MHYRLPNFQCLNAIYRLIHNYIRWLTRLLTVKEGNTAEACFFAWRLHVYGAFTLAR